MNPENTSVYEDGPEITSRAVKRPEGFDLDQAIAYLRKGKNPEARVKDFMVLAAGVRNAQEARYMRDRVMGVISSLDRDNSKREVVREEWAQQIIAVLNDAIDQRKPETQPAKAQSKARISRESVPVSGDFVVARVGYVTVRALRRTAAKKKTVMEGKKPVEVEQVMLHVISVAGGVIKGVSEGAVYQMSALPKVLQGVEFKPANTEKAEDVAA